MAGAVNAAAVPVHSGPGWELVCRPGEPAPWRFHLPEIAAELHLRGTRLDDCGEHLAEWRKMRGHRFLAMPGGHGESLAVIPFGAEPRLERRWTVFGRTVQMATGIGIHPRTVCREFAVEEMLASGDWRCGEWFGLDPDSGQPCCRKFTWPEHDGTVMSASVPPLAVVLENAVGGRLELGIGEDWWRWQEPPARYDGTADFRLRRTPAGALLERTVLAFPEEMTLASRPWRFTSYFAWHPGGASPPPPPASAPLPPVGAARGGHDDGAVSLLADGWPESALAIAGDAAQPRLCLLAPAVRKSLRHWVRRHAQAASSVSPRRLCLSGVNPGICTQAAHLERPRRQTLLHWDLPELIAFRCWAQRQLAPHGREIVIFPAPDGIFAGLPTLLDMREAVAGDDVMPGAHP